MATDRREPLVGCSPWVTPMRAEVVCVVQDDDDVPQETSWLDAALERFARHRRLAILGGFMGFGSFDPDPAKATRVWGGREFGSGTGWEGQVDAGRFA